MTRHLTELTPGLAQAFLSNPHPKQRRIGRTQVDLYKRTILEGRWKVVDDAILLTGERFADADNPAGSMFNGGHRCEAVIAAKQSILVWVEDDADPSTFDLIDVGRRRSAYQFIRDGYASHRAAAARLTLWHERRFERPPSGPNISFDLHQLMEEVERRHDAFEATIHDVDNVYELTGIPRSVVGAVFMLAYEQGHFGEAADFADVIRRPDTVSADNPARLLAERFRRQYHRARQRSIVEDYTLTARAFNAFVDGTRMTRLSLTEVWPKVGETEADFNRRRTNISGRNRNRKRSAA